MESEPAPDAHLPRLSALPVLGMAAEPAQGTAEGIYLDRSLCFQPKWPLAGRLLSAGQVLGADVPQVPRAGLCCSVKAASAHVGWLPACQTGPAASGQTHGSYCVPRGAISHQVKQ